MTEKVYRCEAGHCVQVEIDDDTVYIRESNRPYYFLTFTHNEWESFLLDVKNGKFDDWLESRK